MADAAKTLLTIPDIDTQLINLQETNPELYEKIIAVGDLIKRLYPESVDLKEKYGLSFSDYIEEVRINPLKSGIESSILKKLQIELTPEEMELLLRQSIDPSDGIETAFPVRPLKGETQLLIGCGNSPIEIVYHPETSNFSEFYEDNSYKYFFDMAEREDHSHSDYYTIDPNFAMNPSVIGHFGYCKLGFLEDNSFETIAYEGIIIDGRHCPELKRLLKPGGRVINLHQPYDGAPMIEETVFEYDDL